MKSKSICVPNGRPSPKLWQFEVSDFFRAFYAFLITLDARFLFTCSYISQERMNTSGHNARMTKLTKTYGFWNFIILFGLRRSRNVIWKQKKMRPKRTTKPKVMATRCFRFLTRILCLSYHLGCSFSVYLLVDLEKLYEIKKQMRPKRTTKPKVMAIRSFRFFTRILHLSNHHGCSFSLYLLPDLATTYENEWSQCSNDQIIKNLWLLEFHNLFRAA